MKEEIYKKVAKELNISEDKVKFIDNHVFNEIQKFLKNPDKYEFLINNFGIFTPKLNKIKKHRIDIESKPKTKAIENRIVLYDKIIELGDKMQELKKQHGKQRNAYKRQKKEDDHNE